MTGDLAQRFYPQLENKEKQCLKYNLDFFKLRNEKSRYHLQSMSLLGRKDTNNYHLIDTRNKLWFQKFKLISLQHCEKKEININIKMSFFIFQ